MVHVLSNVQTRGPCGSFGVVVPRQFRVSRHRMQMQMRTTRPRWNPIGQTGPIGLSLFSLLTNTVQQQNWNYSFTYRVSTVRSGIEYLDYFYDTVELSCWVVNGTDQNVICKLVISCLISYRLYRFYCFCAVQVNESHSNYICICVLRVWWYIRFLLFNVY